MTVAEYISLLERFPQDAVIRRYEDGWLYNSSVPVLVRKNVKECFSDLMQENDPDVIVVI